MLIARAMRRLRSVRAPAIWLVIAAGCRAARATGIRRSAWSARLGGALRNAGRTDEAVAAYVAAIEGGGTSSWADVVEHSAGGAFRTKTPASWYLGLGMALRDKGELDAAVTLMRAAASRTPGDGRWLGVLAELEDDTGNLAEAITVQSRLMELHGTRDPRVRYSLAARYERAGLWHCATTLLVDNIAEHPRHAAGHRLLAKVATSLATWNGSLVDTLPNRAGSRFRFGDVRIHRTDEAQATPNPAAMAAEALARAVELQPHRSSWRAALGEALDALGKPDEAIPHLARAVREAEATDERWSLSVKQRWQFQLERCRHISGHGRVEDPLFEAALAPIGDGPAGSPPVAGLFEARFTYMGLAIHGVVGAAECDYVEVFLDKQHVRSVSLATGSFLPRFSLTVNRDTLELFPRRGILEVRTPDGQQLFGPGGTTSLAVNIPHGTGRISAIILRGGTLDKKGGIIPSAAEMKRRQDRNLEIYAEVRDFFKQHLGRSLFLLYGTLLGYYREDELIPGDDDFDVGYVSDKSDPRSVKEETKEIIVELVRAGFTVSFNRKGRLFRIQLDKPEPGGCHVDVHPTWFQDGNVWIHNLVMMRSTRDDYLPVADGTLHGVTVSAPRNTEAFLRGNYGSGWKRPDPGFRYYPSEVDLAVRRNLEKALITVGEYKRLAARIEREVGDSPTAGRLISLGSQDLYPLSDFVT